MSPTWLLLGLALPCLVPLGAQDSVHFGGQAALLSIQGDAASYYDRAPGNVFGIHVGFPLRSGHEIQARLDWRTRPTAKVESGSPHSPSGPCLGADFLYFLSGRRQGFYLKAGFEAYWWATSGSSAYRSSNSATFGNDNGVEPLIGFGYRFNPMISLDSALIFSSFKGSRKEADGRWSDQNRDAWLVQVGVSIH